ncbi:TPA: NADP-dependent oxidoreductase [Staphylococcus aureus]|nr:NADP-dependent oxidoreductase [Staphylococcus aureus]
MQNKQILFNKIPEGMPQEDTFKIEDIDTPKLESDGVLVQTLYISVDPYMRGRMTKADSYVQPFEIGKPIVSHVVAKVIDSTLADYKKGDVVVGMLPWRIINHVQADQITKVPTTDVPLDLYLSVLGMPGQTAYHGLLDIGQPKDGDTVVVSAASGAVGSVVGQIAKIKGCRVVGIAGGDKKVNYLTETLGFDAGIDVYFENVGGTVGDEVFKHLNRFARVPVCGAISSYNHPEADIGPRIQGTLIKKQVMMRGFLVSEFANAFKEASEQLATWVQEGKIQSQVTIEDGFENAPRAFKNLFTGDNFGKQVIKVTE